MLNLRYLSQYLRKDRFKYKDLRTAMLMLNKNDFLFKFDLKSGYHHLDIFKPHQSYLGFSLGSKKVKVDLASSGLIVNEQKSQWEPEQRLIWLGFEINLHTGQLLPLRQS